jgi:RimJ/RimL family protein N-acetyltransferase
MQQRRHQLKDGKRLTIREAQVEDAGALLDYVECISGESDFLSFGPGEFELSQAEEEDVLHTFRHAENQLYLVGLVDGVFVSALTFAAAPRTRVRHSGEMGLSVLKEYWGLGIGSLMIDTFLGWARGTGIVTKVNLRVRSDNARAIRLYERKGFLVEGTLRNEILLDGTYYDQYWMGLVL